ncbi:hypothetical protein FJ970_06535 [Mesorhizobium sp. B2-1-8]|uniref:hypothetical protein n=1 Tax=unclassified Mesorhizobium TaxID=325217 RepID=UPI001129A2A5|nr:MULTISPECIES: hypothetical protein [unclassified Mesorhizobium]TPI31386.1 hypothetical protein FJW08_12175 [Mesorhizobium sp. B3-2-1]UCI20615.1 hypothetical protein FJ970_06535 [Mesorhizobium sp. B2-1-8]
MKYEWADNPHLVLPITACFVVLVPSFAAVFISLLSIIVRTNLFGPIDEKNLPWSERLGRRNARLYAEFFSPRFRTARRVMAYGVICYLCAFGAAFLIVTVFGHPS